jgi:L-asparaginase II
MWWKAPHFGHIAVVDASGALLYELGDPFRPTFARSSMKPIQALPVVQTGTADFYGFDQADLSLCCASHSGEPIHLSSTCPAKSLAVFARILNYK